MRILNKCVDSSFKKINDGELVFYPYYKYGPKYILSKESEVRIRIFLKIYYIFAIAIPLLFVIFNQVALGFISMVFIISFYLIGITIMLSLSEKREVDINY